MWTNFSNGVKCSVLSVLVNKWIVLLWWQGGGGGGWVTLGDFDCDCGCSWCSSSEDSSSGGKWVTSGDYDCACGCSWCSGSEDSSSGGDENDTEFAVNLTVWSAQGWQQKTHFKTSPSMKKKQQSRYSKTIKGSRWLRQRWRGRWGWRSKWRGRWWW